MFLTQRYRDVGRGACACACACACSFVVHVHMNFLVSACVPIHVEHYYPQYSSFNIFFICHAQKFGCQILGKSSCSKEVLPRRHICGKNEAPQLIEPGNHEKYWGFPHTEACMHVCVYTNILKPYAGMWADDLPSMRIMIQMYVYVCDYGYTCTQPYTDHACRRLSCTCQHIACMYHTYNHQRAYENMHIRTSLRILSTTA